MIFVVKTLPLYSKEIPLKSFKYLTFLAILLPHIFTTSTLFIIFSSAYFLTFESHTF